MLIVESHVDVPTVVDGKESSMRELPLVTLCPELTELTGLTMVLIRARE